jgi:hypothetical protein
MGIAVGAATASRIIALLIALRGTKPDERAAIIRALAEFFKFRIGRRR